MHASNFPDELFATAQMWQSESTNPAQQFMALDCDISLNGSRLHQLAWPRGGQQRHDWQAVLFSPDVQQYLAKLNHFWAATVVLAVSREPSFKQDCSMSAETVVQMDHIGAACWTLWLKVPQALQCRIPKNQQEIDALSKIDAANLLAYGAILLNGQRDGFVLNPIFQAFSYSV